MSEERQEARRFPKALTQPDDMNLDDESLLSAYLDDELDPADRLAVEWSIETNPPLAEQLRSLAQARDAVSRLPRPEIPRDLAANLSARLLVNRRRERLRKLARPARAALAFSGFSGLAASLIFALILLNHSLHESDPPIAVAVQPVEDPRPHHPVADSKIPRPDASAELVSNPPSVISAPASPKITPVQRSGIDEAREVNARRAIAGMLEQSHVRRIRIITDVVDASAKVKHLIHQDGRLNPDFGQISICQEIVIDPECAEAVEVFAVPMDERDRRAFVGQLSEAFPNLVEESGEANPDLVTQLTEVGQVALYRGTEAAPLVDPPHDLRPYNAIQGEIAKNLIVESPVRPIETPRTGELDQNRKAQVATAKAEPPVPADSSTPATQLKPGDRVTVLVWVVTRPARKI